MKANPNFYITVIILVFATSLAPFVGHDQRNFLVIFLSCLFSVSIIFTRIRYGSDLIWLVISLIFPLMITLMKESLDSLTTVGYTAMFSLAYFALALALRTGRIDRLHVTKLLRNLILLYAFVSVIQMITSIIGLPIPNLILSKGSWSYNSLAVEPSHAGRALSITMLVYLILSKGKNTETSIIVLVRNQWMLLLAFFISISLTGSVLAILAAPLAVVLSVSKKWILILSGILWLIWPFVYTIDLVPVQRAINFMAALPSLDIHTLAAADQSGALRLMPLLIYFENISITDSSFWFGQGLGSIRDYMEGNLIGASNAVMAGFMPGYLISFGAGGLFLFLSAFVIRFINVSTLPVVVIWITLFSTSAWNSQLFWYGLMLIRVSHHFSFKGKKSLGSALFKRRHQGHKLNLLFERPCS